MKKRTRRSNKVNTVLLLGCVILGVKLMSEKYKNLKLRIKLIKKEEELRLLVDSVETDGKAPDMIIDAVTEDAEYTEIY